MSRLKELMKEEIKIRKGLNFDVKNVVYKPLIVLIEKR
jgi:hypothetical protein